MNKKALRVAVVVHGRWSSFELANAFLEKGHYVLLLTNYPKFFAKNFGIPQRNIKNFLCHGILVRVIGVINGLLGKNLFEAFLHKMFGQWAASVLKHGEWDLIHVMSGVAEELLTEPKLSKAFKILLRSSSHIRTQHKILLEEEQRVMKHIAKPSSWIIEREEREYALADKIQVFSNFCYQSFLDEGVPEVKMLLMPSGIPANSFYLSHFELNARCQRITENKTLHVLFVGTLCFRKGLFDLKNIISNLPDDQFCFRLVGPSTKESQAFVRTNTGNVEFVEKQAQENLLFHYKWADLFIFPSLEEGMPQVLAQAYAASLPILTTENSGADFINSNETGWVFPIRKPQNFISHLMRLHSNRSLITDCIEKIIKNKHVRIWSDVVDDLCEAYK